MAETKLLSNLQRIHLFPYKQADNPNPLTIQNRIKQTTTGHTTPPHNNKQ
jgi:hypothetical protein